MACPNEDANQPQTILLVEGNPGDVRLVKEASRDVGLIDHLHVVSTGSDALDFVNQGGEYADVSQPDLIILDWHLSGMTSEEVLEELNNDPDHSHIPIIVATGPLSEREIHKIYKKNANVCIPKPAGPDELENLIKTVHKFWFSTARLPDTNIKEE